MSMTHELPPIRLLVENDDRSGASNMAIDECLLESALDHGRATVRVYGWDQATVSLGYFQPPDDPDRSLRFGNLPTVRRLSGGGAILHHLEVTYSIALGPQHPLVADPSALYRRAHDAILSVLNGCGIQARLRGVDHKDGVEPFLCFSRGDKHDIVLGAMKIAGSAQRRRRGAVLQHGSLMLHRSPFAPELLGLLDLTPGCSLPTDLRMQLGKALANVLANGVESSSLDGAEEARVTELIAARYSHLNWGRAPS